LPVVDVARTLAALPRPAPDPAPVAVAQLRGRLPLPGGLRGAGAAVVGALTVGVLAAIAGSPASVAARRVVVASAPPAQANTASSAAPAGDLAALQVPAPRPAPAAVTEPAAAAGAPAAPAAPAAARPKAKKTTKTRPAPAPAAPAEPAPADAPSARPPVRHVVVVALAEAGAHDAFGPRTPMPYLARELRAQGVLLRGYHAIGDGDLPNLLGLLSGRPGNSETAAGCPALTPFVAAGPAGADGRIPGAGCVLGADVPSLPAQLDAAGLGWRAFVAGADPPPDLPPAPCAAPAAAPDGTPAPVDRDPLLFLAAVAAAPDCTARVSGLAGLPDALALAAADAPALTLVVPGACDAGREDACPAGEPAGLQRADQWLREWVPQLVAAPAFADDGMIVVTFAAGTAGDDRTGALVLSPHARPGAGSDVPYDHFALLRTVEDAFGLDHLGLAAAPDRHAFGDDVFLRPG
jgi:hypothetical protein